LTASTATRHRSRWPASPARRKRALILLGIATVAFTVILELIDPSRVSHGPTILAFEFAGRRTRAAEIKAEWGAEGRSAAHLSLVLDYGLCRHRHKPYYHEFVIMPTRLASPALEAVIHR
jgi:hypothetical protein